MPTHEGLTAWIEVDGHRQPEYEVGKIDEDGSITCTIPSIAGKSFTICVHDEYRDLNIGCCLTLDGEPYGGKVIFQCEDNEVPERPSSRMKGFQPDRFHFQPFQFADVIRSDDGDNTTDVGGDQLGQIKVLLSEVKYKRVKDKLGPVEKLEDSQPEGDLDAVKVTEYLRELVKFVFNYRPMHELVADRIASPPLDINGVLVEKAMYTPKSGKKRAALVDLDDSSDVNDSDYRPTSQLKKQKVSSTQRSKRLLTKK
ncbi:hypothetical protein BJ165DRAFT_1408338 [Panaeolus papilionaceus]|nr:hypothetical protein BJ165DRAFT_1408338 [Panaeolus papilionaceus]